MMTLSAWGKMTILVFLLLSVHALLGIACQRVQVYYPNLFSLTIAWLYLAIWVFGSFFLVSVISGLVSSLVHPFRITLLSFAFSALVMAVAWGINLYSVLAAIVYFLLALWYARFVSHEFDNSLQFSVRPVGNAQKILAIGMALVLATSLAVAYHGNSTETGSPIPPNVKQLTIKGALYFVNVHLHSQGASGEKMKTLVDKRIEQDVNSFWSSLENMLKPYDSYLPFAAGFVVAILSFLVFSLFAWVPILALRLIFPFLYRLKIIQKVTESKEIQRYVLG